MLIGTTYYYELGRNGKGLAYGMDTDVPEPSGKVDPDTFRVGQCANGECRVSVTLGSRVHSFVEERGISVTDTWDCYRRIWVALMGY